MVKLASCACDGGCDGLPQLGTPHDWTHGDTSEQGRDSDAFHSISGSLCVSVGVEQAHAQGGAAAASRDGRPPYAASVAAGAAAGPGHGSSVHQERQQHPRPCLSCTSHLAASHLSHPNLARVYNVRAALVTEQALCALDLTRGARRCSSLQPAAAAAAAAGGARALRRQPAGSHTPGRPAGRLAQLVAESMPRDIDAHSSTRGKPSCILPLVCSAFHALPVQPLQLQDEASVAWLIQWSIACRDADIRITLSLCCRTQACP